jgi:uncharacterized membrane protein
MEAHELSGPEHKLERLIFFSDAVFAIAITLLVIDLRAPRLPPGAPDAAVAAALGAMLPNFGGFALSFLVIGAFWIGHHRAFALARRWSDRLVAPNLLLLAMMAALPFFTALLSANSTSRLPPLLYGAWLLLAGLATVGVQRVVTAPPVIDPRATADDAAAIRERGYALVAGAAFGMALVALIGPGSNGLIGLATIPLIRRALAWRRRRKKPT